MPDSQSHRLDTALKITRLSMNIAVILGIVYGLSLARDWKISHDRQLRGQNIIQARQIGDFGIYHLQKNQEVSTFLETLPPNCRAGASDCLKTAEILFEENGQNGEKMYRSPSLNKFREIGDVYETLGTLVREGYLDFDFVFTVVFFPDRFWDETRSYRDIIARNWNGKNNGIDDFWGNFSWLRDQYLKARQHSR